MSAIDLSNINMNEDLYKSSTAQKAAAAAAASKNDTVTHDDFLKLLVTQMTNQDPLKPMQDTEMMAQFAQLQTLDNQRSMTDAMISMRQEYAVQGASSMIGKQVTSVTSNGTTTSGIVVSVDYDTADKKTVMLRLDSGKTVYYSDIKKVENVETLPSIQEAAGLMQKYVVGVGTDGKAYEGIVKNVTTKGKMIYVETYEGDSFPVDGIAQVRELTAYENTQLQEALLLISSYVEAVEHDADGNETARKSGIVQDVYRKNGQYWVETWGGDGIYIKDITKAEYLTTSQLEDMESSKKYVDRFVRANNGRALGIVEGFFFQEGEFYLSTTRGEALRLDSIYTARNATDSDRADYGGTGDMTELQKLNLKKAVKEQLGKSYTGYDASGDLKTGIVRDIYYRDKTIWYGLEDGSELVSPASLVGV